MTAVVRGAVIFGVEKATSPSIVSMSACPRSYGVLVRQPYSKVNHDPKDFQKDQALNKDMAQDQLEWLIKKGDLVLSNEKMEVNIVFERNLTQAGPKNGSIPIYAYEFEDLPTSFSKAWNGNGSLVSFVKRILTRAEKGLTRVYTLEYDLSPYPLSQHKLSRIPGIYVASLVLKLRLAPGFVQVRLCLEATDHVIAIARIRDHELDDLVCPALDELRYHRDEEEQEVSDMEWLHPSGIE